VYLELPDGELLDVIDLFDISGRLVLQRHVNGLPKANLAIADMQSGVYICQATLTNATQIRLKIIIKNDN
jgi:hypothetical protein